MAVTSFDVLLVRDMGARFGQRRNFIVDLEKAVPEFYERIGQHLRSWQAPAPKVPEDKSEPEAVDTEAIRAEADLTALARDE